MEPGKLIHDKYEILSKIKDGGMGSIYKVHHRLLDEIRVVKVMKGDVLNSPVMRQRFLEEAKTATRLKHPNIATIYDFAIDEQGSAYLVMEFIDGVTLHELLRAHGPPELHTTLELMLQTVVALGFLHKKNFVHRDVAPDNIMLTQDEEGTPRIKLIDLGIAKALDSEAGLTKVGSFLGKLTYASPEQFGALNTGETIDGRSDLYSLGVVFYELLTRVRPFQATTPTGLPQAHLGGSFIRFEESDPDRRVPDDVRALVLKAIARNRKDRWASADDMAKEIRRIKIRLPASTEPERTTVDLMSEARAMESAPNLQATTGEQKRINQQFGSGGPSGPGDAGEGAGVTPVTPDHLDPTIVAAKPPAKPVPATPVPATPAPVDDGALSERTELLAPPQPAAAPRAVPQVAVPVPVPVPVPHAVPVPVPAAPVPRRRARPPETQPAESSGSRAPLFLFLALLLGGGAYGAKWLLDRKETGKDARAPVVDAPPAETGTATPASDAEATPAGAVLPAPTTGNAPRPTEAHTGAPSQPAGAPAAGPSAAAGVRRESDPAKQPSSVDLPIEMVPAETTPAASSAPAPAPADPAVSSVVQEEPAIRSAIDLYLQAENTLDEGLVERSYPAMAAKSAAIRKAYAEMQSQEVELEVMTIEITGTKAVVKAKEQRVVTPKTGEPVTTARRVTIGLEKRDAGWVIASYR